MWARPWAQRQSPPRMLPLQTKASRPAVPEGEQAAKKAARGLETDAITYSCNCCRVRSTYVHRRAQRTRNGGVLCDHTVGTEIRRKVANLQRERAEVRVCACVRVYVCVCVCVCV